MEITPDGILIISDLTGKNTGDGYIQFTTQEYADHALLKHKECLDKRLVGLIVSNQLINCSYLYQVFTQVIFAEFVEYSSDFNVRVCDPF